MLGVAWLPSSLCSWYSMEWLALAEDLVSRARELMRCGVPLAPLCGDSSAAMAATGRARGAYPRRSFREIATK